MNEERLILYIVIQNKVYYVLLNTNNDIIAVASDKSRKMLCSK